MDIWLIAVTAATGYLAKQLQNVTLGKDKLLESSCEENVKQEASPKCLLSRLLRVNKVTNEKNFEVDVSSTSEDNHSETLFEHRNWKTSETVLSRRFIRRKDRYSRVTKPMSSLESCLMSQFNREQMNIEDYNMTSPFSSPHSSISRTLLVTDGTRVINKTTADSLWLDQHIRIPRLDSSAERNEKDKSRKHGLSDAMLLIKIGISIGIMSSSIASQAEVNRVKQELKLKENLVHDLEDELEMKDSLIVKELDIEKEESISKIEAELEAELERLEINMNTSKIEMESDFAVEFAEGELIDVQGKGKSLDEIESPSGYSTPESGNYAVSPRELSLRLHQVINSRLENRITELETALQESEKKVKQLVMESSESKKKNSWSWETHEVMRYKSDSKIADQTKTNHIEMQPLVMNLTGKALDAFNDSYDELMKINDDYEDDDQEDFSSTNKSSPWSHHKDDIKVQEQELLDLIGLEDDEEESSELENEMEKELIKHIVEKTKQGSPVVLNAQKMLFLIDETET